MAKAVKKDGTPRKARAPRPDVITIGDKQYMSFGKLHKELCKGVSLKTFKGVLESKNIFPIHESKSASLYDVKQVRDVFSTPHVKQISPF